MIFESRAPNVECRIETRIPEKINKIRGQSIPCSKLRQGCWRSQITSDECIIIKDKIQEHIREIPTLQTIVLSVPNIVKKKWLLSEITKCTAFSEVNKILPREDSTALILDLLSSFRCHPGKAGFLVRSAG